jgi:SAM-dependent methyltransferase
MKEQAALDRNGQTMLPTEFNDYTVAGYEGCALGYARSTAPEVGGGDRSALQELLRVVNRGSRLLEIGSGPGWDADWLEAQGLKVRRTDAAQAFVRFQNSRGKMAEKLNVLADPLHGPYDAVVALYVLQHIDRRALPVVFKKISRALRGGGAFLFSIREGIGEIVEKGSEGGSYYIVLWRQSELVALLKSLRFSLLWSTSAEDSEGHWMTFLARNAR